MVTSTWWARGRGSLEDTATATAGGINGLGSHRLRRAHGPVRAFITGHRVLARASRSPLGIDDATILRALIAIGSRGSRTGVT